MHYIFDVDGTLTPSRGKMDSEFAAFFEHFATHNAVYLVTGSDREKTLEQIPKSIYSLCMRVYQCSGNDVWEQDRHIHSGILELPKEIHDTFDYWIKASQFGHKQGNHIDQRAGLVNFSILGRPASDLDRKAYISWDEVTDERKTIAWCLDDAFGDKFNFQIAGETGIDITAKGAGKEQVLTDFDESDNIIFIGDKCEKGGNDHGLVQALMARNDGGNSFAYGPSKFYNVDSWEDTWEILKRIS